MQSGSFWAFREGAELPDYEHEAPDVRVLWDKRPTARRPHLCDLCNEEIAAGTTYRSIGHIIDGVFETMKMHGAGDVYPSSCPRFADRDRRELADQFAADQALYFPADADLSGAQRSELTRSAPDEPLPPHHEGGR